MRSAFADHLRQVIAIVLSVLAASTIFAETSVEAPQPLMADQSETRQLSAGAVHAYRVDLIAGQYARVNISQDGVDVMATLKNPRQETLAVIDSPNYAYGEEIVSLVAMESGPHTIDISGLSLSGAKGSYTIELTELRPATAEDDLRVSAERAANRISQARMTGSPEAFPEGFHQAEIALALWKRVGDQSRLAVTYLHRAFLYERTSQHREALADFKNAEEILAGLEAPRPEERHWLAVSLRGAGTSHALIGDLNTALDHQTRALRILDSLGYPLERAYALGEISWTLILQSHYQEALEAARSASDLATHEGDRVIRARSANLSGVALWLLGDYETAIKDLRAGLEDARVERADYTASNLLLNLGITHSLAGDDLAAENALIEALELQENGSFRFWMVLTLTHLGETKLRRGQLERAEELFVRARKLARELENQRGELQVILSQSLAAESAARIEEAQRLRREALDRARGLQNPELVARSLALLADVKRKHGDIEEALTHIEEAIEIIEGMSGRLTSIDLRTSYFAARQSYYELWVEILMESHRRTGSQAILERALAATERSRARALRELLRSARAGEIAPDSFDLSTVRDALDGSLLLEFALGEERSYLFALDEDSLRAFMLPPRAIIEEKTKLLYDLVTNPDRRAVRRSTARTAFELGTTLLGPVREILESKRLLIVPDGAMHFLPFGVLILNESERPLIAGNEIVMLPSSAVLPSLVSSPREQETFVAILADPVFSTDDPRLADRAATEQPAISSSTLTRSIRNSGFGTRLPRLPGTRAEARDILSVTEGHGAFDFAANRETFFGPEVSRASIIHIATHGVIDSLQPELTGIVLSLVDEAGKPRDGYIRLNDLFALRIQADLVVLSACRTALGKQVRGEGMIGLTRGLMHSGAGSVVATLWDVDDDTTALLMKHFYRELTKGVPPGNALRRAQQKVREVPRWSAPWFWGGFTLHGDWR